MRPEPARRDGRPEHRADGARADADDDAPQDEELPLLGEEDERREAGRDDDQATDGDAPRTEAVDERAGDRAADAVREDADRHDQRDAPAAPAEGVLERREQRPGAARTPADTSSTRNVATTTTQA